MSHSHILLFENEGLLAVCFWIPVTFIQCFWRFFHPPMAQNDWNLQCRDLEKRINTVDG